jgi:hypothetical protein
VGAVLGATVAACSTGGWFAHAAVTQVNATSSPVARTGVPAAEKRMSNDLASTWGLAPRRHPARRVGKHSAGLVQALEKTGTRVECDISGLLFKRIGGPQGHLLRNARH